ncbi:MAG: hypothetical protein A3J30_02265 [Candidatus Wildermuthbacteria bacterium RIFCSPLOWO2_02_FULL_47_9c]|uniref:Transcription elongation factor GreA n=2 Tax=Parcubacteria group TaxID=1794811 RepID=A0A837IL77_9BACT|nr:MAG: Transcription elongation factor GreA [Candidatus Yanofskybacteria bacterium GW2011_GWC1_48_11]KKW04746.1 MAG: Transcription elongation factor GreA [Parcubacteria group bacterium GW2011_GWB1_49_12]KKW08953.1 MAG: Transcription elongation factor GreA [Parcubacteria group bacterium GW2011_GWA1_49_26]KKW14278.1 MAG: Transcription elongation factor GreA [Parcubacteria group bacterium GW2011_GWA2_50_10]OHA61009.1 MAG: hypothetical protein A2109_02020 [Candidatus Wildermuthbacteria bacterium G
MAKFVTEEGLEKLKKELEHLKTTKQREVAERLRRAIAHGDLSENFEYADAKDEQAMLQAKISKLQEEIREARVVGKATASDQIRIGSTVHLEGSEIQTLQIVAANEADPSRGKISAESPVGSTLLGKKKGDAVVIETPGGAQPCKVLDIS